MWNEKKLIKWLKVEYEDPDNGKWVGRIRTRRQWQGALMGFLLSLFFRGLIREEGC